MTRLLALVLVLSIAGCVDPARFRGWQDPPHKFAACHNAPNGVAACFEQAQRMCPQGYQLAELRSDPAINRHSIIVVCAGLPAAPPPPRNAILAPVQTPPPPPVK
jgi:hypothetical protein